MRQEGTKGRDGPALASKMSGSSTLSAEAIREPIARSEEVGGGEFRENFGVEIRKFRKVRLSSPSLFNAAE